MSLDAFAFYTDRICRKLEPDSIGDGFALPLDFHWIMCWAWVPECRPPLAQRWEAAEEYREGSK
jgi:hypothetical protein